MTSIPRCAQMDLLGRELIEAYRRVDDQDVFCFTIIGEPQSEVAKLHHQMSEHRNSCELCKHIMRLLMDDVVERSSAAAIDATGISPRASIHQSRWDGL